MRKNLCIILILILCFTTTVTYADEENKSSDLQTQRDELKRQLDEANIDLNDIQADLSNNLKQIEKLDEKIAETEEELQKQEGKIIELKDSIEEIEQELEIVTEKHDKQKEIFEKRIVTLYEAGETQYLDLILKSRSLSDFLSNYYVVSQLAEADKNLLDELKDKKKTIDLSKQKIENERKELAIIVENQTRVSRTLQNTKIIRESFISKLSVEEQELQSKIDQINTEYDSINKQIIELAQSGMDVSYIGGVLAWPVPGYTRVTSPYGTRLHPILGRYKLHTGVDIGAPLGADFIAVNDGIVMKAEYNGNYGNMVMINHGGGVSTLYAHGSEILVQAGQSVKRGDPVLKIGSTGLSTGPHAHFEVRINGLTVDPLPYITTGVVPGEETKDNNNTSNTDNIAN